MTNLFGSRCLGMVVGRFSVVEKLLDSLFFPYLNSHKLASVDLI